MAAGHGTPRRAGAGRYTPALSFYCGRNRLRASDFARAIAHEGVLPGRHLGFPRPACSIRHPAPLSSHLKCQAVWHVAEQQNTQVSRDAWWHARKSISLPDFAYVCVYSSCVCEGLLPQWLSGKESTCCAGATGDMGSIPGSGRSLGQEGPWRRAWQPTPVFLSEESSGVWRATVHGVTKSRTRLGN